MPISRSRGRSRRASENGDCAAGSPWQFGSVPLPVLLLVALLVGSLSLAERRCGRKHKIPVNIDYSTKTELKQNIKYIAGNLTAMNAHYVKMESWLRQVHDVLPTLRNQLLTLEDKMRWDRPPQQPST